MTDSADRRNRVRWGGGAGRVLGAAMALIAGIWAEPAAAQTGPAFGADPQWCRLDDPGTWRRLRQEAAEAGASDTSGIVCPERRGAEGALPERLHLPMPCGRTMVFQRIDVPVEHMLDQVVGAFGRRVDLASETVQTSLSSGPWAEAVSGGFTLSDQAPDGVTEAMAKPSARAYYLARYETTEAQALVWSMGLLGRDGAPAQADAPACAAYRDALAALGPRADAAAGGFSWFDGIAFSRDYAEWLLARDAARIADGLKPLSPWEQGSTGAPRLPSEAEWEYAARGGAAASTPQTQSLSLPQILDPLSGEVREAQLDEVCAPAPVGTEATGPVGRRLPNLLGLHDVVCNAEEMTLDLFRMSRPDGMHGQVGGYVTRGGGSKAGREQATVGLRVEKELFRLEGVGRVNTVGVRLAIGTTAFTGRRDADGPFEEGLANEPLNEALTAARDRLVEAGVGPERDSRADLGRELAELRDRLRDQTLDREELTAQVASLTQRVEALNTRLNDGARDKARQLIRAGVVAGNLIDRVGRNMYFVLGERRTLMQGGALSDTQRKALALDVWQARMGENARRINATFDLYLAIQIELSQEPEGFVSDQLAAARNGLVGDGLETFSDNLALFIAHQTEARAARSAVTETMRLRWLDQLDTVRGLRAREFPDFR